MANDRRQEMRLCSDCRFYKAQWALYDVPEDGCSRIDYDPVNGRARIDARRERRVALGDTKLLFFRIIHGWRNKCGPEGKYWEDKNGGE